MTSLHHARAGALLVSENHSQESGVGSAEGATGSETTTGIIAGAPGEAGGAVLVEHAPDDREEVGPHDPARAAWPLTSGTWQATHLTRRSIAPTTMTWPPESLEPQGAVRSASTSGRVHA